MPPRARRRRRRRMMSSEEPMMPDDEPPARGAAADAAAGRRLAARRLVIWQGVWEAWARASVRLGIAHRPCLRTREDCQEVANHMRQAASDVALFARLLRRLAENAELLPSGRVPEAPHAGHRAPEQGHPAVPPVGAPVVDVTPRAGDLPGTQAVARAPWPEGFGPTAHVGQACKRRAASRPPPSCHCGLQAAARLVLRSGPNQGRRFWRCPAPERRERCHFERWDEPGGVPDRKRPLVPSPPAAAGAETDVVRFDETRFHEALEAGVRAGLRHAMTSQRLPIPRLPPPNVPAPPVPESYQSEDDEPVSDSSSSEDDETVSEDDESGEDNDVCGGALTTGAGATAAAATTAERPRRGRLGPWRL